MTWQLKKHSQFSGTPGPVVLAILDGVGVGSGDEADAVRLAATPTLDRLWAPGLRCTLAAHGTAVGLPGDGDMGNSEVGHNALGCGRVYDQGALLVNNAISNGSLFDGQCWQSIIARCQTNNSAMHFLGLLSDGNVHSHIDHLIAMLRRASSEGVKSLFVHILLDGRDVPATSALGYVDALESVLAELSQGSDRTAAIASGGGRMSITMDRYDADWPMVERGWNTHVLGRGRQFASARSAIETFRDENPEIIDQFLPPFVIAKDGNPVAPIRDGDAVVNFNFRGDRAMEISIAFDAEEFDHFDRGDKPDVFYAGMMEYDGDTHIPKHYLVEPPDITRTMGEYLTRNQVSQLAISETQKYGHVTYFWNGNKTGKFDDGLETYVEIASDLAPFEQRPWMKAAEITDQLIANLRTGNHRFARVNYANGDMVGHTGDLHATITAIQAIDIQLARLRQVVAELKGILVITADHGNADEMYQRDKKGQVVRDQASGTPQMKTSHTLNPVPFMIYDPNYANQYRIDENKNAAGLANVTATCVELLGFSPPPDTEASLLDFR